MKNKGRAQFLSLHYRQAHLFWIAIQEITRYKFFAKLFFKKATKSKHQLTSLSSWHKLVNENSYTAKKHTRKYQNSTITEKLIGQQTNYRIGIRIKSPIRFADEKYFMKKYKGFFKVDSARNSYYRRNSAYWNYAPKRRAPTLKFIRWELFFL